MPMSCGMNRRRGCPLHKRHFRHKLSLATIYADFCGIQHEQRHKLSPVTIYAAATIYAVTRVLNLCAKSKLFLWSFLKY